MKKHVQLYDGAAHGARRRPPPLADARTRALRIQAHDAFDPLWRGKGRGKRGKAYAWLAEQLGVPEAQAHMGGMSAEMCERVIALCLPLTLAQEFDVVGPE